MVYCGIPSKGCSSCRKRKIRCDEKEPSCGQCQKSKQDCPGYRNPIDLSFRDETNHVINKAKNTRPRPNARKNPQHPSSNSSSPSPRPVPSAAPKSGSKSTTKPPSRPKRIQDQVFCAFTSRNGNSPSQTSTSTDGNDGEIDVARRLSNDICEDQALLNDVLSAPVQERGIEFFFSRYVNADNGCQNYSFIFDFWKPADSAQADAVTLSMAAVGLAGLSQLTNCTETKNRAHQSYIFALKFAQDALQHPIEAVKDTTLLAVLILGTYEFVSGHGPQTKDAWQVHVNGAAALADRRGPDQFRTKAGIQMFIMLSQSVLISCIQSGLPMPQTMVELSAKLQPVLLAESSVWRVVDPIYTALRIRNDIRTGKLNNIHEIIDTLSRIDDEFTVILSELPSSWNYRRILLTRSDPRVFGLWCHVYPGRVQATTWNAVRAIRMLVLETILEKVGWGTSAMDMAQLSDRYRLRLATSIKLLGLLGEAIVASVPQHFGVVSFRDGCPSTVIGAAVPGQAEARYRIMSPPAAPKIHSRPGIHAQVGSRRSGFHGTLSADDQGGIEEHFMTLATSSNTIIWPLYVLGTSRSCSPEIKQYAINRLYAIHNETGFEQARLVAKLLQNKENLDALSTRLSDYLPTLPEVKSPNFV